MISIYAACTCTCTSGLVWFIDFRIGVFIVSIKNMLAGPIATIKLGVCKKEGYVQHGHKR